jgi:MFS family permease
MDVIRVCSGNLVEMYDFMVFGYFAADIGAAFFPAHDKFASLMASLATFGVGFLMRPLGAVVLGAYIDKVGRRRGLILTLALMSVGTASLALTPGYAQIGLAAPIIVVAGRLLQGFSAGVELGGVSVYLYEIAPERRRGFFVSWQSASQQLSVVLAASLGIAVNLALPKAETQAWGWRIPLLVGCAIIPILFVLRRSLAESPVFAARKVHPPVSELLATLGSGWARVLAGMMMVTMTTVTFYLCTAYTPTFAQHELGLSATDALWVTLMVGVSNFVWLPLMGALSDRVGRRRVLVSFAALALVSLYPAMRWLVAAPSLAHLLATDLWISFLFGGFNGAMLAYLVEFVPPKVRAAGFSLAYSLATALFGGFTPAIATSLIHATHDKAMPGAWAAGAAALGLVGAAWAIGLTRLHPAAAETVASV